MPLPCSLTRRVITLTAWSFHVQKVAADWMVMMPFSHSSSILSIVAPTPSLPRTCHGHGVGTMAWRCR